MSTLPPPRLTGSKHLLKRAALDALLRYNGTPHTLATLRINPTIMRHLVAYGYADTATTATGLQGYIITDAGKDALTEARAHP
jgi:hypothetical protein